MIYHSKWSRLAAMPGVSCRRIEVIDASGDSAIFELASLQIRAEYEIFDTEDTEDVTMISAGIVTDICAGAGTCGSCAHRARGGVRQCICAKIRG
jgi:hypothetical protein